MTKLFRVAWRRRPPRPYRSVLAEPACTCSSAPAAACMTCARWRGRLRPLLARRAAWSTVR